MDLITQLLVLTASLLICLATSSGITRAIPVCDQVARARLGALSHQARCLMVDTRQLELWLRIWCGAMIAVPLLMWIYQLRTLIPVGVWLLYVAPVHIMRFLIICRRMKLRDQLVPAIGGLANAVQAGLTLQQGIAEINRDTPKPLHQEFARILADYERGRPLAAAIDEVRRRLQLEPFTLFATAIQTALERGGRINEALMRIACSLREHQRLERKMEADTSAGRREVLTLSLFPAAFAAFMYLMDPSNTRLLVDKTAGQCVLVVVVVLVYAGARWALKMMDVHN